MQQIFNLESMKDLHRLFCRCNECKFAINAGESAMVEYAVVLSDLSRIDPKDTEKGEALARKGLEQVQLIANGVAAQRDLEIYSRELEGLLNRLKNNVHVIVIDTEKPNFMINKEAV
jgi:hypothetical protein